jgi:glutamine cyclotransferase
VILRERNGLAKNCCGFCTWVTKTTRRRLAVAFLLAALTQLLPGQSSNRIHATRPLEYTFKIVRTFPHDPTAFTQGLAYRDGFLYEGTGLKGRSSLRKIHLETGAVVQRVDLAPEFFGEGITLLKNEVVQLTWQSQTGFVYNLSDFRLLRRFSYSGEGWGLTTNGKSNEIFMSNGTPEIRILDSVTLTEKRRFTVHDGDTPINQLNELEFVDGEIFANVWQTDRIARISPKSGAVVGWIDLTGLLSPIYRLEPGAVLNGIAYDSSRKRLFVTGKLWPSIFEIRLVPKHPK